MKWKKFVCAISIISMLFSASQVAYASYDYISKDTTNIITISNIGIELVYSGETADILTLGKVMHKEVAVKNVGKKPVYVRLQFDKYWSEIDPASGQEGARIDSAVCDPEYIQFDRELGEDWTYNEEDGYYYYGSLLDVGATTTAIAYSYEITEDILEQVKDEEGNVTGTGYKKEYQDRQGNVTAYSEAVQEISDQFVNDYIMFASEGDEKVVGWNNDKITFNSTSIPEVSRTPAVDASSQPNVEFADNASEFITVHGDNLFLNMSDMLPGDTKSQDITIANNSDEIVDIYMYAKPAENDYDSQEAREAMELLLQNIELEVGEITVQRDGVPNEIYKGSLGDMCNENGEDNKILLGNFQKGDKVDLRASITLNPDWNIGNAETKIVWVFLCRKQVQEVTTTKPILPQVVPTPAPPAPAVTKEPTPKPTVPEKTPGPVATVPPTEKPKEELKPTPTPTAVPTPKPTVEVPPTEVPPTEAPTPEPTKGMIGEAGLDEATAAPMKALPTHTTSEEMEEVIDLNNFDPNGNAYGTMEPQAPVVESTEPPYTNPKTGDENRMMFWGVVFIISLAVFSMTLKSSKKKG